MRASQVSELSQCQRYTACCNQLGCLHRVEECERSVHACNVKCARYRRDRAVACSTYEAAQKRQSCFGVHPHSHRIAQHDIAYSCPLLCNTWYTADDIAFGQESYVTPLACNCTTSSAAVQSMTASCTEQSWTLFTHGNMIHHESCLPTSSQRRRHRLLLSGTALLAWPFKSHRYNTYRCPLP